jgi:predicted CopG family antitoxin
MPNMTLSLPDDVYRIVKRHKEIRWSEVARRAIEDYAKKLSVLDAMAKNSELPGDEVILLDADVKAGIGKHYRRKAAALKR